MTKIYFILIFLISFVTVYAQNESDSAQVTAQTQMPQSAAVQTFPTKTEADSAYIRNDFAASVEMYENILKNEGESSDIYYNFYAALVHFLKLLYTTHLEVPDSNEEIF